MIMEYEKLETKIPRFNGTRGDDIQEWTLCVKALLSGKQIFGTLADVSSHQKCSGKAFTLIVTSLGDNPLRTIQDFQTAKEA